MTTLRLGPPPPSLERPSIGTMTDDPTGDVGCFGLPTMDVSEIKAGDMLAGSRTTDR